MSILVKNGLIFLNQPLVFQNVLPQKFSEHSVPISGKRPYLSKMAENKRNKVSLREEKVASEFCFFAYWLRYGRF